MHCIAECVTNDFRLVLSPHCQTGYRIAVKNHLLSFRLHFPHNMYPHMNTQTHVLFTQNSLHSRSYRRGGQIIPFAQLYCWNDVSVCVSASAAAAAAKQTDRNNNNTMCNKTFGPTTRDFHLHDFCLILKTFQFAAVVFRTGIRVLGPTSD